MALRTKTFWLGVFTPLIAIVGSLMLLKSVAFALDPIFELELCPPSEGTRWSSPVCMFEIADPTNLGPLPPPPPPFPNIAPCPTTRDGYQLRDTGLANAALCRHACGEDCDPDDCSTAFPPLVVCVNDSSGQFHRNCTYSITQCGSNDGCRVHDDCYDDAVRQGETANCLMGGLLHCVCDEQCIANYGLRCNDWRQGLNYQTGPNPVLINYISAPTYGSVQNGPCP